MSNADVSNNVSTCHDSPELHRIPSLHAGVLLLWSDNAADVDVVRKQATEPETTNAVSGQR